MNYFKGSGGCGVVSSPNYNRIVKDLSAVLKPVKIVSKGKRAQKNNI